VVGESDLSTLLRSLVLNQLASNDHAEVVQQAKTIFNDYITKKKEIVADLRGIVYKTAVAKGGSSEYQQCLNIYRTAELQEEKLRALRALGSAEDPELIKSTLALSLTDEVRAQDLYLPIIACAGSSKLGRELTWQFVKNSWPNIHKKIGNSAMLLDRIIAYSTQDFASEEKAAEVKEFFTKNPVPSAERTIKQSVESILDNAKWLKKDRQSVANWLNAHAKL